MQVSAPLAACTMTRRGDAAVAEVVQCRFEHHFLLLRRREGIFRQLLRVPWDTAPVPDWLFT